jgi:hypothetical protein
VLLRYSWFRRLRPLILLTSLIVLGFFNGGCPCMISSMQNFVLWSFGESVRVHSLFWFLALLPLTYSWAVFGAAGSVTWVRCKNFCIAALCQSSAVGEVKRFCAPCDGFCSFF